MRTLLLADDNLTVQRVIALTFAQEAAIRVVAVSDGQVAIEKMEAERPDIVLAATTLPQVSGYDLARFLRGQPEWRGVPVLLMSGAFETVDQARLAASGAKGVIEKPVEPTVVINRVKELLGLKADDKPSTTGRMITPADSPGDKPTPTPSRAGTAARVPSVTGDQPAAASESTPPSADPATKAADYLATLDSAFETLDQHLSGKAEGAAPARNPSGPLAPSDRATDPRSPGQKPPAPSAAAGNPVFEIDDDWFGTAETQARADARAGRRDGAADHAAPEAQAAPSSSANPIFEVDEEWFAEDEKTRAAQRAEQERLAKEMGIHDVDLPPVVPAVDVPKTASTSDFDFGMADFQAATGAQVPEPAARIEPMSPIPAPVEQSPPPAEPIAPIAELSTAPAPEAPSGPAGHAAADFDALLAAHQVERREPSAAAAPITQEVLDQVATHIIERLQAGVLRDQWRDAMAVVAGLKVDNEKIDQIGARVAERLQLGAVEERLREVGTAVSAVQITDEKLDQIANRVAERLHLGAFEDRLRDVTAAVSSVQITDEKLDQIASRVADRLHLGAVEDRLRDLTAAVSAVQITDGKLDQLASTVAARLRSDGLGDQFRDATLTAVRDTVRSVVSETSERLVREEIERIKSQEAAREDNVE